MTSVFNNLSERKHIMKPWIKRTLFTVLGTTALVATLSACGDRHHGYGAAMTPEQYSQKRDKMVERVAGKLDLTDDQKKRLTTLGDKLYEQRTAFMGASNDPRAEMKQLVSGDKFDAVRAQALVSEKTNAIQGKSPEVIAAMADFYNSLNPAQQQKVRGYLEHRGGWLRRS
jgi:periplasmic protein CpxP/Spy